MQNDELKQKCKPAMNSGGAGEAGYVLVPKEPTEEMQPEEP